MASPDGQQTWVPLDCSRAPCSQLCPRLCFAFLTPPPPFGFSDDSSGPSLSPLVIALIGILASVFLLVSYYVLISRYCGGFDSLRRRMRHDSRPDGGGADEGSARFRGDQWQTPPPGGLEEWVIRSIAVCRYKRGDGLVESTDCSVCLSEFRDGESLRLLPDCCHAFHIPCIDTWLKSHSNCPLCRANIVYTFTSPSPSPPRPPPPPPPATAPPPRSSPPLPETRQDTAVTQDTERGAGISVQKDPLRIHGESGASDSRHGIVELTEEGIPPTRRLLETRVSVANALRPIREHDFPGPTNDVIVEEAGPSMGFRVEQHACKVGSGNRVLHCVMSPVHMKPFVGGRFCFTGQGKDNHGSILPL